MSVIHFVYADETFVVNDKDQFSRPKLIREYNIAYASDDWKLLGAVEFKFGNIIRHYTVDDIRNNKVPWHYKNGKQRCFFRQYDHGSQTINMSPKLIRVSVFKEIKL